MRATSEECVQKLRHRLCPGGSTTAARILVGGSEELTPTASVRRVLSIDILRGATIALMILVNDPGDPHCVYAPLRHADWNGYTAADLVFPNFLFLSGASLVFSLQSRIANPANSRAEIVRGMLKRTLNPGGIEAVCRCGAHLPRAARPAFSAYCSARRCWG